MICESIFFCVRDVFYQLNNHEAKVHEKTEKRIGGSLLIRFILAVSREGVLFLFVYIFVFGFISGFEEL